MGLVALHLDGERDWTVGTSDPRRNPGGDGADVHDGVYAAGSVPRHGAVVWRIVLCCARAGALLTGFFCRTIGTDPDCGCFSYASLAPMLVLAGGFVSAETRTLLFAAAMGIDVLGALSSGRGLFRISAAHFAERYGLIVIIAMGESVIATGIGAAQAHCDAWLLGGITVMLLESSRCFGRTLTGFLKRRNIAWSMPKKRTEAAWRATCIRFFTSRLWPERSCMPSLRKNSGIMPTIRCLCPAVLSSAGIGLFLLGFVLGSQRVGGLVMYERLLAISLIAVLSAVPPAIPGLALAALVLFVLACALALEHRRRKRHPAH